MVRRIDNCKNQFIQGESEGAMAQTPGVYYAREIKIKSHVTI